MEGEESGWGGKGGQNWTAINGVAGDNEDSLLLINDDAPRPDGEVSKDAIMFTNHVCAAPLAYVAWATDGP